MKSARGGAQQKNVRNASNTSTEKTAVQVFCRLRPLQSETDLSCIEIKPPNTVVFKMPTTSANYRMNMVKETHYIFKHVFPGTSTQREVYTTVAEPLVEELVRGKDGLLFTYGVTGSGKTYTMTGNSKGRGIMPRCLDALFKTISGYQSKKFVFKPDRLNGFEIQSEADAMLERQVEMNTRFAKPRRQDSDSEIASQASSNTKILDGLEEDNMFAVFITYVEIYNNSVYDLLEEGGVQRTLQSKIIREDSMHNMYVHGVTEIEVKSFEEAIEVFQTGQKRKRVGHTILNAESSRSHSVFTIRLVQAPSDLNGENVIQDRNMINISQLSLVDLAGSERTNRTKNSGQRLREAGNINNSLMTLRTCLEYLRENQLTGSRKKVPYRDSKLTHYFKKYFEGEGQVNMIVCVNPRAEDFDETACVLKFAEMSQEVQTTKSTPAKLIDLGLTPGRRKAAKVLRAIENDLDTPRIRHLDFNLNSGLIYSLGAKFPDYSCNVNSNINLELMQHLRQRIDKRALLLTDFNARCDNFRSRLLQVEKENLCFKTEISSANAMLNQERGQLNDVKNKAISYENSIDVLNRKMHEKDELIQTLQRQLNQKQCQLNQKEIEKERQKKKYTSKMAIEADKLNRKLESRLREQESKQIEDMRIKDEKLRLVSNILKADNIDKLPHLPRSTSFENLATGTERAVTIAESNRQAFTPRPHRGVPVSNVRHRRSRSAGDRWLEHRAKNPVPVDTIFQPYLKNRKSVTKLTDVRDVTNSKTSKYCLVSQEADTEGELETKLYKGNVIPTCGGGAQVVFDDVECLKQISPNTSPNRKRTNTYTTTPSNVHDQDLASKCSVGMGGHSTTKRPKV